MIPRRLMNNDKIVSEQINEPTILNGCKGSYFNGLKVFGKSTQVTTTGAQLLNIPSIHYEVNGVFYDVNSDGSVTVKGTATNLQSSVSVKLKDSGYTAGEYYVEGSKNNVICRIAYKEKDSERYKYINSGNYSTLINFSEYDDILFQVLVEVDNTANDIVYPMLIKGNKPLPFEPYTGGKPSPNPEYPQQINSVGERNNLFPILKKNFITTDGLKSVINFDGSITVTGTPTKYIAKATKNIPLNLPVGKYYINGGETGTGNILFQLRITYNDGTTNSYPNKGTFSITDKVASVDAFLVYTSQNLQPVNYTIYPMLNKGDKPLPFEKYVDNIEVNSSGGNLFPILEENLKSDTGLKGVINRDGSITVTGTPIKRYADVINIKLQLKKGFYTIGGGDYQPSHMLLLASIERSNGNINYYRNETFEIYGNEKSIIIKISYESPVLQPVNYTIYPMLNVGSAPLAFEPYKPKQTLTIPTPNGLPGIPLSDDNTDITPTYIDKDGKGWVCDEIDLERGKYVQRVKKETGLVFEKATFNDKLYECVKPEWNFIKSYRPVVCDHLKYNINLINVNKTGTYAYGNSIRAKFKDSQDDITNINNLKTYTFMYILDKPIERDLTPGEITSYKSIHTYATNTTITSEPNVSMDVTYRKLRN